ncbi:ABC transporter permease [Microbacterium sp. BK668]|uniref:ABC transporter permease n=1 Tax=Microbacterium sp. BK668 TaxID=2512118 RepID=UPI0010E8D356|nr:ABC transporter permease [Microbacterium sp. BK668]TDN88392.1 ABC-2 type transport system permease protein [Microbacterium sp. BK668]
MSDSAQARFERLSLEPLTATNGEKGLRGTWGSLRAVFSHRELLDLLIRRDIKARYKDSALGLLWTLINPIVQLCVYYLVMGQILGAARGIDDFAIYVFSGLTIFGLFSDTLSSSTASIVANSGLVKKVYVPREVFPLSSVGSALFTSSVQIVVLIVACFIIGAPPLHLDILYAIPSILLVLLYAGAFGILLSALNVYLRDVQYLTQIVIMLSLWAAPIVYGWTMVSDVIAQFNLPSWLLELYTNNPLTLAVLGFHRAFWTAGTPADYPPMLGVRMLIMFAIGLVVAWICQRIFSRLQGNFAQEL